MLINSDIFTKFLKIGLCFLLFIAVVIFPASSYAVYDGVRSVNYEASSNRCGVGRILFDPFSSNKDINWEITNPACIGYIAGVGTATFTAEMLSARACNLEHLAAETALQMASGVPMSPAMIKRRIQETRQCGTLISAGATASAVLCCGAIATTLATTAVAVSTLAAIWDQAGITFESARICGHNWSQWEYKAQDVGGSTPGESVWIKSKGPHLKCLENLFLGTNHPNVSSFCEQNTSRGITNKSYREFIYGGVEYTDNGAGSCGNPATWDSTRRGAILGYSSNEQRYYMRGPGNVSIFACYRYRALATSEDDLAAMEEAYDCCKRRSQETICIENRRGFNYATTPVFGDYDYGFCNLGSRCDVAGVVFEAYQGKSDPSYGCAKTYSVCPYNHLIGGGTELSEVDSSNNSRVVNFCQLNNHCSKLPVVPYVYNSNLTAGYISQACRDLKGDSQNVYGYTAQLVPINTRGFSAPLVQCFKETMENIFLHKAGHSSCINPSETPINDVCSSGYVYRKGGSLPGQSFFMTIQDSVQSAIKVALVASVVAFGFAILMAVPGAYITKKVLMGYVLKIGLIMYFAIGDAWQFGFMQGVIGTSSFLADVAFKVDENVPLNKLDGCQFPRFNYNSVDPVTKYNNPQYPPTKEYLRIWDILDCKIARAIGFGPEVSVPNLVMAIVGGFFTGGLGIVFFVATFIFAFFLISMTIKAMHIFIMSITSVIVLLYVSPITITAAFFERTKGIFQGWWKQLLGFTLQPMILFAYLGILVSLLDNFILGSATFSPSVITVNGQEVIDTYGRMSPKQISCTGEANNDSLYCIFNFADIQTFSGFEPIGIGIPMLASMNGAKLDTIIKAAMVMFIFSTFMDQIMTFASKLVGGTTLKSDWGSSTGKLLASAYALGSSVQSRGMRGAKKHIGGLAKGLAGRAGGAISNLSSRGKSVAKVESSGRDHVTSGSANKGDDKVAGKKNNGGDRVG